MVVPWDDAAGRRCLCCGGGQIFRGGGRLLLPTDLAGAVAPILLGLWAADLAGCRATRSRGVPAACESLSRTKLRGAGWLLSWTRPQGRQRACATRLRWRQWGMSSQTRPRQGRRSCG